MKWLMQSVTVYKNTEEKFQFHRKHCAYDEKLFPSSLQLNENSLIDFFILALFKNCVQNDLEPKL